MMELNDSTAAGNAKAEARSGGHLGIDLNEIPSPPQAETLAADLDSADLVRSFHYNLHPPPEPAAGVPGEGRSSVCGACGRPEVKGEVVVCDGCERGFHLSCAGMQGSQQGNWEWVCAECSNTGVNSKRWPLGVKSKHILDINASPPSDGEGVEELQVSRKHTRGDNSFGGNPFGAPVTYSNLLYTENGYGFQKASGIMQHGIAVGFQDITHPAQGKIFEEVGYAFGKISNLGVMLPPQNPGEILQALRDFISERRGVLGDGWRVEFKQSIGSCGLCAIYCAPDGKIFNSMSEVARYLGLMSNCSSPSPAVARSTITHDRLQPYKRRKLTKFSNANGFLENKETIKCDNNKDLSSGHIMGNCTSKLLNDVKATEAGMQENIAFESQQANDGFPVQFEDFFVLSSGTVDVRPSYHDANFILPVGYRSCWHDKVTGSLFWCEVLDGGDSGPVFKVRRHSCSTSSIPIGSTVLVQSNTFQCVSQTNGESDNMSFHSVDYDNDGSVQMMLVDPSPPLENEVLSCLGGSVSEHCTAGTSSSLQFEGISGNDGSENLLSSHDLSVKDVVGEISVEERSPALAWRSLSKKFIAACSEICKEGKLKFICKHVGNEICSPYFNIMDNNRKASFSSLAKFCSSQYSVRIPSVLQGDRELDSVLLALEKWLNQDRFGLDAEFVLEIIEQLPDVKCCSQYKCLKERSDFPSSLTVGNGLLSINTHAGLPSSKGCRLFGDDKKTKLARDRHMDYPHPHPPGKPMGLRLPPQLVGDVYQVWELLWRFHEILGLSRPLSLEELEEELINPWSDRSGLVENLKSRIQGNQSSNLHDFGGTIGQAASTDTESGTVASREDSHSLVQMETGKMNEAAQCGITNFTYGRYFGKALTKAHNALLKVLITELQSKVAALVDPTFDAGESKTKRGRKKEGDSSFSSRRTKLNMLPINELTWPELARRYILAVISMDGNLDSAEITARESVKVFRCLQGDGGLLCGSLTGVAGMEADALLLAEASKKISASPSKESDVLTVEDEGSDASGACEKSVVNDVIIPEWAKVLEPVRKLPTNVGTRIRKCVYEALEMGPPEWAKEILEHSISKEVYKGNASGPTKKAVLSLLANVCSEGLLPRPEKKKKKKTVISASDIIMKQCRIVLRHAAAADDAKVFCNLLGRKPISSSDNDDEGFLGSPGTVSRPLDFRTIDLRLAVGAYGGSHEAFLEDVRELWCIVRAAYTDQPDLVELAETLSQNFESMYEKEVVILAEKFVEYVKSDSLSAEMKKEIIDIVASTNEMPKAPWDEGVCKVCGIDRDDDSVLLCDTCDAEYHTYCLNPPLARIPEGNWYCPSCAAKRMVKDASERTRIIGLYRGKKYQGEVTRVYLESLARLADMMEQKEYWEFTVEERTSLLKFLCDDLLCSSLLRQHIEQCADTSVELQQRLRSLSVEWRNLKSKEEILSARAAKEISTFNSTRESSIKERHASPVTNNVKSVGQTNILSDSLSYATVVSGDLTPSESNQEGSGRNGFEKTSTCKSPTVDAINTGDRSEDRHAIVDSDVQDNTTTPMYAEADEQSSTMDESTSSEPLLPEKDDSCREIPSQGKLHQGLDRNTQPTTEQGENCLQPGMTSNQITQHVPPVTPNEPQSYQLELNSVRNDILLLEDSITIVVSELLKSSIRREFLGVDSNGRMYWASASLDGNPQVIVDGSLAIQQRRKVSNKQLLHIGSARWNSVLSGMDDYLNTEGSKAHCPYLHESNTAMPMGNCSPWGCYQTDSEIKELLCWLKDNDPRERELKDSIMNWQKIRFSESQQTSNQGLDPLTALSMSTSNEQTALASFVTKAATVLEKKYGPCHDAGTSYTDIFKKRGKKAKVMYGEKMYRCECLEPIWPSRYHCSFCHITFSSDTELEGHSDCKCSSDSPASEKSKVNGSFTGKGILRSEIIQDECADEMGRGKPSKTGSIKFKENKVTCPYNFDEICSKFVTNNSNKELVQEIGLLGSNGVPSLLPSISPFIECSAFMYDISGTLSMPIGKQGFPSENGSIANSGRDCITDASSTREKLKKNQQAFRKFSLDGRCSVVPQSSLRPLIGKISHISKSLKANLLDMDAALPEEALRPSKTSMGRRNAWRAFVKSSETIFEMVQATMVLENTIRAEYLRNEWWYWSSLTAAAKTSTMSSLALRIYSLDAAIIYEKTMPEPDPTDNLKPGSTPDDKPLHSPDPAEKTVRVTRKSSKKRKEPE